METWTLDTATARLAELVAAGETTRSGCIALMREGCPFDMAADAAQSLAGKPAQSMDAFYRGQERVWSER